ncbi:MAG TPA: hypothetical protein VK978_03125 [Candidatus Saccharimonadales bacterium]|nr:hypothetical protein [Candidatus Saccharimonadales bacterium]
MKQSFRRSLTMFAVLALTIGMSATPMSSLAHSTARRQQHTALSTPGSNQAAATTQNSEYRRMLDAVLREHAALTVPALKAQLLQEPDRAALMAALDRNSMMVAGTVAQAYPGTRDPFLSLWREHIQYYMDYLAASAASDQTGRQEAQNNLLLFTDRASILLDNSNRRLNEAVLKQQLTVHGMQVLSIIDNLVAGNYPAVYTTAHQAYLHMGTLTDTLVRRTG